MSQRGSSPSRPGLPDKRKTSPNSGSGRERNGGGEGARLPSESPQDSLGRAAERRLERGKSGSKSASPANGVDARGGLRSPEGRVVDRGGEREPHRDAKHHRREHDRRHDRDGSAPKRARRDSRESERRRGSESGREAGEITDDRSVKGEHKRQKTEHRHRSHSRHENGREAPGSRLPLPPKPRSPEAPRLAPESIRQAALEAQARRLAAEKAAAEKAATENDVEEKRASAELASVRGKHSPIVWGARGGGKSLAASPASKPPTAMQRATEELAAFQRSQAELGHDADAPPAMKASPSGSESENGGIRGAPSSQPAPLDSTSDPLREGEGDAAPTVVKSRWQIQEEEEEDYLANGKAETEDNLAALNSHEQQELELAKEIEAEHEADAEEERLSVFQRTRPPVNMLNSARQVECFERLNTISEGTYGVVHRARDKETGTVCALKKIKMDREKEGFPITSIREINILLNFHHRNLVDVSEVVVGASLDDIFMVMEFMEHDLKGLIDDMPEPFTVAETKNLMHQLLTGMAYLHDNWVLHRDLKTSNILYNNEGQLKICDFGMARQYGSPLRPYTPTVVTLYYRSIELLLGATKYSTAVDIWSLGCIMAELLTKNVLFKGTGEMDQIHQIFKIMGSPNEKVWPGHKQLENVKKITIREQKRTIREVLPVATRYDTNSGLTELGFDLIENMLALDPNKRISAEEALRHPWFNELPRAKDDALMPTFPTNKDGGKSARQRKAQGAKVQGGFGIFSGPP